MTTAPKELTPQEREAVIAILIPWNGSRLRIGSAIDRFPNVARAILAEARKQIALLDGKDHADPITTSKRVPVQIAVAIGKNGGWTAFGSSGDYKFSRETAIDGLPEESYSSGYHVVRIHADVPLPPDDLVVVGSVDLPQAGA